MEKKRLVRPFDIVVTKKGGIGIATEVGGNDAHIEWFINPGQEKCAWWCFEHDNGIRIVGNAMKAITNQMAHPFGGNTHQADILGLNGYRSCFEPNMSLSEYCRLCKHYIADDCTDRCNAGVCAGDGSNGQNKCVFFESEEGI